MTNKFETYFEYLLQKRYSEALRIINELHLKEVLDVGCNVGNGYAFLGAIGVDIDYELLIKAKRLKRLEVIRCDAQHLPFKSMTFDIITCFEVIEHVDRPRQLLNEVFRVLKSEGSILLTTPNKNFLKIARPLVRKKKPNYHVEEYNSGQLKKIVLDSGFIETQIKGLGAWIPDFLIRRFPRLSDYLGKVGLNYTFSCKAKKPSTRSHSNSRDLSA